MLLTILTPTYNRQNNLKTLYQSLQKQSIKGFEWLIVDDGSTDDTKRKIEEYKSTSDFPVRYIYKENGGKHTALNLGIKNITTILTFIVDSDDALTPDAVEVIFNIHKKYENKTGICGYSFLRQFTNGEINGNNFAENEITDSYINVRINGNDTYADKAEVFFTRCLKEFPFPEYPGEKFLGEDIVWVRMARKYKMVHINKAFYICEYLEGGLTKNRRKNNIASAIGCLHRAEEFMERDINWKYRVKAGLQYIIYGKFAGYRSRILFNKSKYKLLLCICLVPAELIYRNWKNNYIK